MLESTTLVDKMAQLERLCPGVRFSRTIENNVLRFTAPSSGGGNHWYQVNLSELGISAEKWFDDELARREPSEHDAAYSVLCGQCGKVKIGRINYIEQMRLPDSRWICPQCGEVADFDDDAYHDYFHPVKQEASND